MPVSPSRGLYNDKGFPDEQTSTLPCQRPARFGGPSVKGLLHLGHDLFLLHHLHILLRA
jgi:hypothetical protein